MTKQKLDAGLLNALARGDAAIRHADFVRSTGYLLAIGRMIVEAAKTMGVEADYKLMDNDRFARPVNGMSPQFLVVSLDGPVDAADPEETHRIRTLADSVEASFRTEWQRADGKPGRFDGDAVATVGEMLGLTLPGMPPD